VIRLHKGEQTFVKHEWEDCSYGEGVVSYRVLRCKRCGARLSSTRNSSIIAFMKSMNELSCPEVEEGSTSSEGE